MKNRVNLLPWRHRKAGLLRTLLPRWCAVWIVALLTFAAVFWFSRAHYAKTLAVVSARESAYRPIAAIVSQNSQMRQAVRRFGDRETLVGQLHDDLPVLCFLATVSRSAQLCEGRLVLRDLRFQQQAEGSGARSRFADPGQAVPDSRPVLTIEGDALDNLAIARFAAALRDAALFRDVVLESSVGKTSADRSVHSFVVRCEI
ncbi:MAG: PilN domain-containing protein [Planctomycetaceae bacterium]|nr:PilN domain-containing protein [Planctomycetaceae bacterium]